MSIEHIIFANILKNEDYVRKVLPFLKTEYFENPVDKSVFNLIHKFVDRYSVVPSKEALLVELHNTSVSDDIYQEAKQVIEAAAQDTSSTSMDWLIDSTEAFCKERALYNAIMEAIRVVDKKGPVGSGELPKLLSDALAVSFDTNIGHDYLEDAEERYDYYHEDAHKIEFDLEKFNIATKGGFEKGTLNVFMAATGVGKSLVMSHMSAAALTMGFNVLYITLEMGDKKISQRIDANLMNTMLDDIKHMEKEVFLQKISRMKNKTTGKIITKQFPAGASTVSHFRYMLNELKLKKNFTPDILVIDYLNLMASSRIKNDGKNIYAVIKSVAEELRGLCIEFNLVGISATQTNRNGVGNSDVDLSDTSESMGLPATVDFMAAIMQPEEMKQLNQYLIKQLKSRYGDINSMEKFVIGVDKPKMRLYDTEANVEKQNLHDHKPVMDFGNFGEEKIIQHKKPKPKGFK